MTPDTRPSRRTPLVTAVIPAYNAAAFVRDAVGSVLDQTHPHVEVVVVDDGSRDDTLAVARRLESTRVTVLAQPNRGASAARNAGLTAARGEYVQFLDADDLLHPDKIAVQVDRLLGEAPGAVAAGAWGRFVGRPEEAAFRPGPLWEDLAPVEFLTRAYLLHAMMHPAAWLVPRALAERAGPWDARLGLNDDGEYFGRVVLQARAVAFCAEARSYYRSAVGGSLSSRKERAAQESELLSYELCGARLLEVEDSARTRRAAAALLQRFVYDWYPASPDLRRRAEALRDRIGGADIEPDGPPGFHLLRRFVGWRTARRVQRLATRHAVGRAALRRRLSAATGR